MEGKCRQGRARQAILGAELNGFCAQCALFTLGGGANCNIMREGVCRQPGTDVVPFATKLCKWNGEVAQLSVCPTAIVMAPLYFKMRRLVAHGSTSSGTAAVGTRRTWVHVAQHLLGQGSLGQMGGLGLSSQKGLFCVWIEGHELLLSRGIRLPTEVAMQHFSVKARRGQGLRGHL